MSESRPPTGVDLRGTSPDQRSHLPKVTLVAAGEFLHSCDDPSQAHLIGHEHRSAPRGWKAVTVSVDDVDV
jgi:hypothetical protein